MFTSTLQPWGFGGDRALKRLEGYQHGMLGYKTGIPALDEYCQLDPGEYTVIGARSATGKTAIGIQIAVNVRQQMRERNKTGGICIFSAEMNTETLIEREACAVEKVPYWHLKKGLASDTSYKRVADRIKSLSSDSQMLVDESSSPTLEHMVQQLQIQQDEVGPVELVLVDYTELVGEWDKMESQRIAKISRGLKAIAKQFTCPVIALSQLNRDIEGRENKRPTMRDLMHGGEREPDRIMIMVRPELYDDDAPAGVTNVTIVKNRNGPVGQCALQFDGESMRFVSMERIELNE